MSRLHAALSFPAIDKFVNVLFVIAGVSLVSAGYVAAIAQASGLTAIA